MKRSSFLKALFIGIVAPKSIIKDLAKPTANVINNANIKYIAGYMKFSKQFLANLPWLQETLPKMLLRDFYKKENDLFNDLQP